MTLREYIIEYRRAHDLSQRQFANLCGVTNGYISMIENGVNPSTQKPIVPKIDSLIKIANGTGMSLQSLLEMIEDHPVDIGESLTRDEKTLLRLYRQMTNEERAVVLKVVESITK